MAEVAPSPDQTANLMRNLTLESPDHESPDSLPPIEESPNDSKTSTKEKSKFSERPITPFFPRSLTTVSNTQCGLSPCCYYGCCNCFSNHPRPHVGSHYTTGSYGGFWPPFNYGAYGYRPYGSYPLVTPTPSITTKNGSQGTQKTLFNPDLSDEKDSSKGNGDKNNPSKNGYPVMGYTYPSLFYGAAYRMYPNKSYGYNCFGYDPRFCNSACFSNDSFKSRGPLNADCLDERNRGPRIDGLANQNGAVENKKEENSTLVNDGQYNLPDFPEEYTSARFFVIKSYSEDDVHKSIKYNVWSSTPNGNKKLNSIYNESEQSEAECPIFLLFSVNTSGQFVGLAEMVGPVDFDRNVEFWQQDKWTGCFPVKWHIVKDVSNNLLRHITLENNENKPVTNSRDTQEVMLSQGIEIIKVLKNHVSKTRILDDFSFYEEREKIIIDRKAKRLQPIASINGDMKASSSGSDLVSSNEEKTDQPILLDEKSKST